MRLHRRDGAGPGSRLVRDVRARHPRIRSRARRAYLMSREPYVYTLSDWTVEKRERGWNYARSANRHSSADWREPYRPEASIAMVIARQLRREITERYRRQLNGGAP